MVESGGPCIFNFVVVQHGSRKEISLTGTWMYRGFDANHT